MYTWLSGVYGAGVNRIWWIIHKVSKRVNPDCTINLFLRACYVVMQTQQRARDVLFVQPCGRETCPTERQKSNLRAYMQYYCLPLLCVSGGIPDEEFEVR